MSEENQTAGKTFEQALRLYKASLKSSMKWGRYCSELALKEFANSGNASQCQQFYEATKAVGGRNFGRMEAFKVWVQAHAPLFIKDDGTWAKAKDGRAFNVEGACSKPYWEFAPDPTQAYFTDDDVVVSLENAIKKFENGKKFKAKDEAATRRLAAAKMAVQAIKKGMVTTEGTKTEDTPKQEVLSLPAVNQAAAAVA